MFMSHNITAEQIVYVPMVLAGSQKKDDTAPKQDTPKADQDIFDADHFVFNNEMFAA